MENIDISTILVIIGIITVVTNLITEVLKKALWDVIPTNLLVLLIAEALTVTSGAVYMTVTSVQVRWYYYVALVVIGLLVAYSAMFGFDKLRQALEQWDGDSDA